MNKTMRVALMVGPGKMEMGERPVPVPGDDQALVKVEYVGICGSDIHILAKDWGGRVTKPHVLGHECAGTVVRVGRNVTSLVPGDRVALEAGKPCRRCDYCVRGLYNLCVNMIFFGAPMIPPVDGTFLEYVAHDADLCFKLPDGVSTMEGALIEPFAVGLHAAAQGGAGPDTKALVLGSGCIGLMSLLALRSRGVTEIIVADIMDKRLDMARDLGADAVINSASDDLRERVAALTGGGMVDLVVDTAAVNSAVTDAVYCLRKGGTMVFVGYSADDRMTLPFRESINRELTFKTVFRYRHVYPLAIDLLAAGRADVKRMVTNVYDFADIARAMDESTRNKAEIVKAVVRF